MLTIISFPPTLNLILFSNKKKRKSSCWLVLLCEGLNQRPLCKVSKLYLIQFIQTEWQQKHSLVFSNSGTTLSERIIQRTWSRATSHRPSWPLRQTACCPADPHSTWEVLQLEASLGYRGRSWLKEKSSHKKDARKFWGNVYIILIHTTTAHF